MSFENQRGKSFEKSDKQVSTMWPQFQNLKLRCTFRSYLLGSAFPKPCFLIRLYGVYSNPRKVQTARRQVHVAFLRASYVPEFQPSTSARVGMAGIAPCRLVVRLAALLAKARMASSFSGVRASRSSLQSFGEGCDRRQVSPAPLSLPDGAGDAGNTSGLAAHAVKYAIWAKGDKDQPDAPVRPKGRCRPRSRWCPSAEAAPHPRL